MNGELNTVQNLKTSSVKTHMNHVKLAKVLGLVKILKLLLLKLWLHMIPMVMVKSMVSYAAITSKVIASISSQVQAPSQVSHGSYGFSQKTFP
jgi:hypothetical protein